MRKNYYKVLPFILKWAKFMLTVPATLHFLRETRTSAGLFFYFLILKLKLVVPEGYYEQ